MPGWRWRHRWRRRGRPPAELILPSIPRANRFIPEPCLNPVPISITFAELEALRLVYLERMTQRDAAKKMGTSRGTIWRLVKSGREKIIRAIVELRPIIIIPGGELREEK